MTIAFVLQTFKDPDQIERLVTTLVRGTDRRLVVVNHSGPESERMRLAAFPGIDRSIPSPGGRGSFGVIEALISSMRWLERQNTPYEWLAVMSGQDYPIRPLAELESELSASVYDGHFWHFDAMNERESSQPPMRWTTREATDRYLFHYAPLKANPHTLDRAILKIPRLLIARTKNYRLETSFGVMLGRRPARTPFSQEFKLYGGSYWMIIRRTAVRAALELVDERPDIVNYFRHVISPEESFLQTVLANDKRLSLSRQELRLWDFENGRHGFARFFGVEDLEHLCASGRYIARKFDRARDSRILDELDRIVLDSAARRPKSLRLASG